MSKDFVIRDVGHRSTSPNSATVIRTRVDDVMSEEKIRDTSGSDQSRVSVDSGFEDAHQVHSDTAISDVTNLDRTNVVSSHTCGRDQIGEIPARELQQKVDPEKRNDDGDNDDDDDDDDDKSGVMDEGDPECEYIEVDKVDDENTECNRSIEPAAEQPVLNDPVSRKSDHIKAEPTRFTDPEQKKRRDCPKDLISHKIERMLPGEWKL